MEFWDKVISVLGAAAPPAFLAMLVFLGILELSRIVPRAVAKKPDLEHREVSGKPEQESNFRRALLTFAEYLGNVSLR